MSGTFWSIREAPSTSCTPIVFHFATRRELSYPLREVRPAGIQRHFHKAMGLRGTNRIVWSDRNNQSYKSLVPSHQMHVHLLVYPRTSDFGRIDSCALHRSPQNKVLYGQRSSNYHERGYRGSPKMFRSIYQRPQLQQDHSPARGQADTGRRFSSSYLSVKTRPKE